MPRHFWLRHFRKNRSRVLSARPGNPNETGGVLARYEGFRIGTKAVGRRGEGRFAEKLI
jgi:hypothetical protein